MFSIFGKKNTPVAIVLHDDHEWHVHVYERQGREWAETHHEAVPGANPYTLPEEAAAIAVTNGARRLRLLIHKAIHCVTVELDEDLEKEEAQTLLAYELADGADVDATATRIAAVRADRFQMGGDAKSVIASPFDSDQIAAFDAVCRAQGVLCEGVGSVDLAVLNVHARQAPETRCLIVRDQNSFYVTPATSSNPFSIQAFPVRFQAEDREAHPERYERMARQLSTCAHLPIVAWSFTPLTAEREREIRETVGPNVIIEYTNVHAHARRITRHAAWAPETGSIFYGCAMVGKGERPKDPHRAGNWLCVGIVLFCALALVWSYHSQNRKLEAAQTRKKAWQVLEQKRKSLHAKSQSLSDQRNASQSVTRALRSQARLPNGLLPLLDLLCEKMPVYTRLTRLYEDREDRSLVLVGTTCYQEGLDQLSQEISRTLQSHGLYLQPASIEASGSRNELHFSYRIAPRGQLR